MTDFPDGPSGAGILPHLVQGEPAANAAPVVLLHGFGGDAFGWTSVQLALVRRRRSIAFDLPGHGRATGWHEIGHAGLTARAVTRSLDGLGIERAHLVGHSMGGAVAALIALRSPERLASLTLLAPGGFGREINHRLLRRFAAARTEEDIAPLLEQFFGDGSRLPRAMAAQTAVDRATPGRLDALQRVAEAILDGDGQRTVDVAALGALERPVKVVWGFQDRVLPIRQTDGLPPTVALHRFPDVGHMPHLERVSDVARLIAESLAHG